MTPGAPQDQVRAARSPAPKASVICTARNAASTIGNTIRSVQAQDFQNWEMIIVDDGSTDETVSIVHAFAQADLRIRLVATAGIGRGRALNRALTEACAGLVANIDADDEIHPYFLRCLLQAMHRHPQYTVMSTEWIRINGAGRPDWPDVHADAPLKVADVTRSVALYNPINHSSVLMQKAAIIRIGGYDEQRRSMFDYDLWVRCVAAGLRLGQIELPLASIRVHSSHYLHSARFSYLLASAQVQTRAIRSLGVPWYLPFVGLRLFWGIFPRRLRLSLRCSKLRRYLGGSAPP